MSGSTPTFIVKGCISGTVRQSVIAISAVPRRLIACYVLAASLASGAKVDGNAELARGSGAGLLQTLKHG